MEIKALFTDLDGTLLDDGKEITAGNREAIDMALAQGHKVIITTGRPLISAVAQAEKLGLTADGCYVIAFNGGVIYDMGKHQVVYRETMPIEQVYALFDEANRRKLHIQTYEDDAVLVEPRCDGEEIRLYTGILKMNFRVIPEIRTLKAEPPKCLLIGLHEVEPVRDFEKWVQEYGEGTLDAFFSNDTYLEVVPKGMNKGTAVHRLAEVLGIPMENTIAVGDAPNDLTMISEAGLGVCMVNGYQSVKDTADYITELDNNHDGVAEVIRKFMLN